MATNVLGTELECCCSDPVTGFYRNGKCDTGGEDMGLHIVCIQATEEFLEYSRARGNDLSTPAPQYDFPGLKPGDRWCLCVSRWVEASEAGFAPKVFLKATHISTLEHVSLDILKKHGIQAGLEEAE